MVENKFLTNINKPVFMFYVPAEMWAEIFIFLSEYLMKYFLTRIEVYIENMVYCTHRKILNDYNNKKRIGSLTQTHFFQPDGVNLWYFKLDFWSYRIDSSKYLRSTTLGCKNKVISCIFVF